MGLEVRRGQAVVALPVGDRPADRAFLQHAGSQIDLEDRWAIVLYIRALQRSQNATSGDIPADELQAMPNQ